MAGLEAEIRRQASDPRVELAMKLGAMLEGGRWQAPWPVGDSGTSFGPFQIHLPAHPGVTRAEAEDPAFAVRYMLPEYQAAVKQITDESWARDPKNAAALAAFKAERPEVMYPQARIDAAYRRAVGLAGDLVDRAAAAAGGVTDALGSALGAIVAPLTEGARRVAITGAFVTLGLVLVGMGAWQAVGPRVKKAGKTAAGAGVGAVAGSVAGPAGTVAGGLAGGAAAAGEAG